MTLEIFVWHLRITGMAMLYLVLTSGKMQCLTEVVIRMRISIDR